jgi:hypothetical protein
MPLSSERKKPDKPEMDEAKLNLWLKNLRDKPASEEGNATLSVVRRVR